jgi:hypothetical protein
VQFTGSILVSNVDPGSTVLDDRYFEIVDRYRDLELTPERFEAYRARNAPRPMLDLIASPLHPPLAAPAANKDGPRWRGGRLILGAGTRLIDTSHPSPRGAADPDLLHTSESSSRVRGLSTSVVTRRGVQTHP